MRGRFCDGTRHGLCGARRSFGGGLCLCGRGIGPGAEGLKGQIAWLKERKRAIEERIKRLEASSDEESPETRE